MDCPLCHSSKIAPRGEKEAVYTLQECVSCGAQFWWPLKHPGQEYYETPVFRRGRLQWRQQQFLKHPPIKKGRVLDIGCGLGNFVVALSRRYPQLEVWGIDIAQNHIDFIKENYGLKYLYAEDLKTFLKRADLPKFDTVTLYEIIEHVENPEELLNDIKALLAPGGYLIITTPNLDRLGGVFAGEDLPPHHFWRWHPATLKSFVERNGFKVTRLIEQPAGKDLLWRSFHRSSLFNTFKAWVAHRVEPKTNSLLATSTKPMKIKKENLRKGDILVIAKDISMNILATPIFIVRRLLGWKYWDTYVEAKMTV
jgi:2-polyprenyl-3-methyl-5-hydroxy-6-metoxy-1,4-benzoquinol methylase